MEHIFKTNDSEEAKRIIKSLDMASAIFTIKELIRNEIKYHDKDYEDLQSKVFDILEQYNIDIDDLLT